MEAQSPPPHARSRETVGAVVVAAGRSARMGGIDKTLASLIGRPLVAHCLDVLSKCSQVDSIALVLSAHNLDEGRRLVEESDWSKISAVCVGGSRRQDSVLIGVDQLSHVDWVLVHDGARPCLTQDMIVRGLTEARKTGAAAAAVPVKDTIKLATQDLVVTETLPRERLWAVQTPQVFRRSLLAEAHQKVLDSVTDDAAMVERIGGAVRLFHGSYDNIKVTTLQDISVAEAILDARATSARPFRNGPDTGRPLGTGGH